MECYNTLLTWTGGTPPYQITVLPGSSLFPLLHSFFSPSLHQAANPTLPPSRPSPAPTTSSRPGSASRQRVSPFLSYQPPPPPSEQVRCELRLSSVQCATLELRTRQQRSRSPSSPEPFLLVHTALTVWLQAPLFSSISRNCLRVKPSILVRPFQVSTS